MILATNLSGQAQLLKKRFLAESLLSAFASLSTVSGANNGVAVTATESRLFLILGIGTAMAILLCFLL